MGLGVAAGQHLSETRPRRRRRRRVFVPDLLPSSLDHPSSSIETLQQYHASMPPPPTRNGDPTAAADPHLQSALATQHMARTETRVVKLLRACAIVVLLGTAALVSTAVYRYTHHQETKAFQNSFSQTATQVLAHFHGTVERNLGAVASLATQTTSWVVNHPNNANINNNGTTTNNNNNTIRFPFVSLPDFELRGSDLRALSGSHLLYWCPLVTDDTREDWEAWALANRQQKIHSFLREAQYRDAQDVAYGYTSTEKESRKEDEQKKKTEGDNSEQTQDGENEQDEEFSKEEESDATISPSRPWTVLNDGTQYHPKIWSSGAVTPRGDEPVGDGTQSYLPLWQQSPVDAFGDYFTNLNTAHLQYVAPNTIETLQREHAAIMNHADLPHPDFRPAAASLIQMGQYRHSPTDLTNDLHTVITYPVFDSFDDDTKQLAGVLYSNIYWKILFSNLGIPSELPGITVVIENTSNQTFAYRIDDKDVLFLGMVDPHDSKYDDYMISTNVNEYLQQQAGPANRGYKTVPLSNSSQYTLRIYPSAETEASFRTNEPVVYTIVTSAAFLFAASVFLLYSIVVERRQHVMTRKVIKNARRAGQTERELNEFLSHEIRNPLSAAISASSFVTTAINEPDPLQDSETQTSVRQDMEVVTSSLHFVNDFLRSMLDIYRAADNRITVDLAPVDIRQDILEPVSNILYSRLSNFDIEIDCAEDLMVMTDSIRLKQVVLNLARVSQNSHIIVFLFCKLSHHGCLRTSTEFLEICRSWLC